MGDPRLPAPLRPQSAVPLPMVRRSAAGQNPAYLRMKDTVIVFARAPRLGTVKRRLARDIGDRAALRFHMATLTALLRDLLACRRFDVLLAVTPDRACVRLPVRVRRIGQGGGDLGRRMSRGLGWF